MSESECVELARAGTDHAGDVHSQVLAVVDAARLLAALGPTPSGLWLALDAAFVAEPDLDIRIAHQLPQLLTKLLAGGFVLSVRPGLGDLERKALLVQEADDRGVADLDAQFLAQVTVELDPRPVPASGRRGLLEGIAALGQTLGRDLARAAGLDLVEQAIDAALVEGFDPSQQRSLIDAENVTHAWPAQAHNQGHHRAHPRALTRGASTLGRRLEFGMRGIFGIGLYQSARHRTSEHE